jgi:hypothetical protein
MNGSGAEVGALLLSAFLQEADCYGRALQVAAELGAACQRSEGIDERLRQVFALLEEVAAVEARIAPVKQAWEQAGRPAGTELRAVMDRVAALILQLKNHIQTIEEAVRARRDAVAAELDVCNRGRQMQRAYQGRW